MKDFLHHLFIPRESNNHRPKILHHKSILFVIAFIFLGQFALSFFKTNFPSVLGTATNISVQELLSLTNQKRSQEGLPALVLNDKLSYAAQLKAGDMFEKNYWAHNAPEGTTPWVFIKKAGYDYVYAGENLARGFSFSADVVNAWIASPSHRENMLSKNYREIGFAVLGGKLSGEDTVLVVEMFGGAGAAPLAKQEAVQEKPQVQSVSKKAVQTLAEEQKPLVASVKAKPIIDVNALSSNTSIFILFLFISIFFLDMIIIERKKIIRVVGHNMDHILFLTGILILVILFSRGVIL